MVTVLAPCGIDPCCGRSRPLGEALDLHDIPREPVLVDVVQIIALPFERTRAMGRTLVPVTMLAADYLYYSENAPL